METPQRKKKKCRHWHDTVFLMCQYKASDIANISLKRCVNLAFNINYTCIVEKKSNRRKTEIIHASILIINVFRIPTFEASRFTIF